MHAGATTFETVSSEMTAKLYSLLAQAPPCRIPPARTRSNNGNRGPANTSPDCRRTSEKLRTWSPDEPIPWYRSISSFLFGRDWVTASFWQDWYGIIPLLVGSVLVSIVALFFAVPLGVAAAIYVSEIASVHEKRLIKPYIEFISAIPSVVLGFFGIAVVGQAVRAASQSPYFSWVSFFPISERLNIFTAGLSARPHGGADDLHPGGRCPAQCPARVQGGLLRVGREPAPNDRSRPRARLAVRHRLGCSPRAWPRHRRNHGRAALRRKPDRHSRFHARAWARSFSRSTP